MDESSPLAGTALRYPEKTFYLGQVFNDTTNSYKLVWFLALLTLISRNDDELISINDIFTEMAVVAWHPVCLYRLSLGRQDKLQDVIRELQTASGLPFHAAPEAIRKFVNESGSGRSKLEYFRRYVPSRFLAPWFADKLRGEGNPEARTRKTMDLAKQSQATPFACPYFFDGNDIRVNASWREFLVENLSVVQSFTKHHFALYLQARNPNVPGIVNKLRAPTQRQLILARDFWRLARTGFEKAGRTADFQDIYSERPLGDSFSIDHFLPWSFVVHDLLWNLIPVEPATNSSKNDVLPDLDLYLPRLAKLQFIAIKAAKERPKLLEDYADCFKQDPGGLVALGPEGLLTKYRDVIVPQAQIAINQGFMSGWKFQHN